MEEIAYLILTIVIELPVALVLLRKEDWRRVVLAVVGVNMISHPLVWQAIFSWHANWYMAEAIVAIFEGLALAIVFRSRWKLAFVCGVFMNVVTAAIGYLIS
jgi:hypothetical protein